MKGYKAFNKDLTCRGMQYEVGQTYEMKENPICCKRGYHFCKNISDVYKYYDMSDETRICEISAIGEIVTDDDIKYCTNKIKIVKEIKSKAIKHCNVDKTDVGYCNSGSYNSGSYNSGSYNSGSCNSGDYNSGYCNSGSYNSGDCNSGSYNSGSYNSGSCNSGSYNSGSCNSGSYNSGSYNSGYYNSGSYNSGIFNTKKNPKIQIFDNISNWTYEDWITSKAYRIMRKCPYSYSNFVNEKDMTNEEKERHPEYKTIGGYIKTFVATTEVKQKWWDELSNNDKEEIYKLPNFNKDKFKKCVGIKIDEVEYGE